MKALLLTPAIVLFTAATGWAIARASGWDPRFGAMILSGAAAMVAGELAVVSVWIRRDAPQAELVQATLIGMVVHLLVLMLASGMVIVSGNAPAGFTVWLLAFFWNTLAGIAMFFVRVVRTPRVEPGAGNSGKTPGNL